ncbi:MAG: hypothetical protein LBC03_00985 [Nitrososphaerota archaeon]|jgi:hypothetical protein|nr:hypothetical protein [Nitrososphaerota archaeon]
MNTKSKINFRYLHNKVFFVSLLFVALLVSSCLTSIFSGGVSPFVLGASDKTVSNEVELRSAVNNAVGSTVIALNNDITLTEQLVIPAGKDITLTSTSTSKFFKLIGADARTSLGPAEWPDAVIIVLGAGVLRLDGIVVTCTNNPLAYNKLVRVEECGTLILYNGEISGNSNGDGVVNGGTFEMYGGKISNNNANAGYGGGVYNSESGTFSMFGGEISDNTGFGVYNRGTYNQGWSYGTFNLYGGVISNNDVGGVSNSGIFSMSGGEISNNLGGNTLQSGGGVSNSGIFNMSGGVISNNQATKGGGVYNWPDGEFSLSEKGVISNNNAEVGGGVYNAGTFNRRGGVISDNTAAQYSDIYSSDDSTTTNEDNNTADYTVIIVSIVVSVIIIVGGVFLYFRKRTKAVTT